MKPLALLLLFIPLALQAQTSQTNTDPMAQNTTQAPEPTPPKPEVPDTTLLATKKQTKEAQKKARKKMKEKEKEMNQEK